MTTDTAATSTVNTETTMVSEMVPEKKPLTWAEVSTPDDLPTHLSDEDVDKTEVDDGALSDTEKAPKKKFFKQKPDGKQTKSFKPLPKMDNHEGFQMVLKNGFCTKIPDVFEKRELINPLTKFTGSITEAIRHYHKFCGTKDSDKPSRMGVILCSHPFNIGKGETNGKYYPVESSEEQHLLDRCPKSKEFYLEKGTELYPIPRKSLYYSKMCLTMSEDMSCPTRQEYLFDCVFASGINMNTKFVREEMDKNSYSFQDVVDRYVVPTVHNALVQLVRNNCSIIVMGDWNCGEFAPRVIRTKDSKGDLNFDPSERNTFTKVVRYSIQKKINEFLPYFKQVVITTPPMRKTHGY